VQIGFLVKTTADWLDFVAGLKLYSLPLLADNNAAGWAALPQDRKLESVSAISC